MKENLPHHLEGNNPEDETPNEIAESTNETVNESTETKSSPVEQPAIVNADVEIDKVSIDDETNTKSEMDSSNGLDHLEIDLESDAISQDEPTPVHHEPVPATEEQFMEANPVVVSDEIHEADEADVHETEDLTTHSKEDLVGLLEKYVEEVEVPRFKVKIAAIRDLLNQYFSQEKDELLAKFTEDGSLKDDFQPTENVLELRFHQAIKKFNKKRIEFQVNLEKQRQVNLDSKREILGLLKDLIQNEENMNKAFDRFHELQARWRALGPVPSGDVRDLQMTYKFFVEKFYDYIKINRELQELDQRRNLDAKLSLCEQAEDLFMEQSINTAFKKTAHVAG